MCTGANVPNELYSFFKVVSTELPDVTVHSREVAGLCRELGQHLSYSDHEQQLLQVAALFHDIGKFFIPRKVLYKPASLTISEFEVMREHVGFGARYLALHEELREASVIVGQHHERYDGGGYPNRIPGRLMHPLAKTLTIVDAFCAMTEQRAYNRPRSTEEAIVEIRKCAGTHFDPEVADVFCNMGAVLSAPRTHWQSQVA